MRWRVLVLTLAIAACGRSSLMGTGGVEPGDMGRGDMGCRGGKCPGDMGDMFGDPCADKANCKLPECVGDPRCHVPGTEICNNGLDDDDDGLIDCKDPDCATFTGCQPH